MARSHRWRSPCCCRWLRGFQSAHATFSTTRSLQHFVLCARSQCPIVLSAHAKEHSHAATRGHYKPDRTSMAITEGALEYSARLKVAWLNSPPPIEATQAFN